MDEPRLADAGFAYDVEHTDAGGDSVEFALQHLQLVVTSDKGCEASAEPWLRNASRSRELRRADRLFAVPICL